MSARVKLTPVVHTVEGLMSLSLPVQVGEVTFEVPQPVQVVDGSMVISPVLEPGKDGRSVSMRLDAWQVYNAVTQRVLPLRLGDMVTATRVAREFEADPGISWRSDAAELDAWALSWLERDRQRAGGER